jgi:glycosyltransferase involved in cell wall biosynthesis
VPAQPLVSILIPAYNAGKWLADTLRSAVGQTWPNKEIIVVNDGSRDETLSIARQFESNMVRVVSRENQGAAATRNHAFSLAQGDFVQWLDADDLLAPEKVARQMEVGLRCSRQTLLSSPFAKFLYRPRRAEFTPTPLWENLSPTEWLVRKMGLDLHMQTATWLVSRELTEAAGPWDTQLLGDDDGEYFCRVLLQSEGVQFVPEARVYYRASGTSSLSYIGHSDRKREAQWRSMLLHIQYLRSLEDSPRTRPACVNYLQNWLVFFYPERMDLVKEAEDLAVSLDGRLVPPKLSWKYAWIQAILGWESANRARIFLRALRWQCAGAWDKAALRLESGTNSHNLGA